MFGAVPIVKSWVRQQMDACEDVYILSDDNRFIARFEEATPAEQALAIAAPDLLAACRHGLFLAESLANLQGNEEARNYASFIRAAITKATTIS